MDATVTVHTRSGLVTRGVIRNVSASGVLICAPASLPLHAEVLVQIELPAGEREPDRVALAGEVARLTSDGFAIEWSEFAPEALRSFVRGRGPNHDVPPASAGIGGASDAAAAADLDAAPDSRHQRR